MREALKPCPFCGREVRTWYTEFGVVNIIECKNCTVRFIFPWYKAGAELAEAWNKRAGHKKWNESEANT